MSVANLTNAGYAIRFAPLSKLVRMLEADAAGASTLAFSRCQICGEGFGREGRCADCVRVEIGRRYGAAFAIALHGAVKSQRESRGAQ